MPKVVIIICTMAIVSFCGCANRDHSQKIVFLDGAGHFGAGLSVKIGLRNAGYNGEFKAFPWTSGLGWGADHLLAAKSSHKAAKLARKITEFRKKHPQGYISIMSLSAGSAVLLSALECLPDNVQVDYVVLFQPSVSDKRNLAPALEHIKGKLYTTCSRSDAILAALPITADGKPAPAAGRTGFRIPANLQAKEKTEYEKVVILPWQPKYRKDGWGGGHVSSTKPGFVKRVIAPRILPEKRTQRNATGRISKAIEVKTNVFQ